MPPVDVEPGRERKRPVFERGFHELVQGRIGLRTFYVTKCQNSFRITDQRSNAKLPIPEMS